MASDQPPHKFTPNHPGANNSGAQSTGAPHPAQAVQGAMDNTTMHPLHTQIAVASEAEVVMGHCPRLTRVSGHSRINFQPTNTCAECGQTCPNNYALEQHAAKERHKAFQCTCTTKFVRLATLNRHIAAQAGPKHHCIYCDSYKGFAREDKLIDHLRASHKFGENAIAQYRSQAHANPKGSGHASPAVGTTGVALPVPTSAGHDAVPGGLAAQAGYSAGPSAGAGGVVDGGVAESLVFSPVELQPFGSIQNYPVFDAVKDLADFDFSDIDLAGFDFGSVDWDVDMSGIDDMM